MPYEREMRVENEGKMAAHPEDLHCHSERSRGSPMQ